MLQENDFPVKVKKLRKHRRPDSPTVNGGTHNKSAEQEKAAHTTNAMYRERARETSPTQHGHSKGNAVPDVTLPARLSCSPQQRVQGQQRKSSPFRTMNPKEARMYEQALPDCESTVRFIHCLEDELNHAEEEHKRLCDVLLNTAIHSDYFEVSASEATTRCSVVTEEAAARNDLMLKFQKYYHVMLKATLRAEKTSPPAVFVAEEARKQLCEEITAKMQGQHQILKEVKDGNIRLESHVMFLERSVSDVRQHSDSLLHDFVSSSEQRTGQAMQALQQSLHHMENRLVESVAAKVESSPIKKTQQEDSPSMTQLQRSLKELESIVRKLPTKEDLSRLEIHRDEPVQGRRDDTTVEQAVNFAIGKSGLGALLTKVQEAQQSLKYQLDEVASVTNATHSVVLSSATSAEAPPVVSTSPAQVAVPNTADLSLVTFFARDVGVHARELAMLSAQHAMQAADLFTRCCGVSLRPVRRPKSVGCQVRLGERPSKEPTPFSTPQQLGVPPAALNLQDFSFNNSYEVSEGAMTPPRTAKTLTATAMHSGRHTTNLRSNASTPADMTPRSPAVPLQGGIDASMSKRSDEPVGSASLKRRVSAHSVIVPFSSVPVEVGGENSDEMQKSGQHPRSASETDIAAVSLVERSDSLEMGSRGVGSSSASLLTTPKDPIPNEKKDDKAFPALESATRKPEAKVHATRDVDDDDEDTTLSNITFSSSSSDDDGPVKPLKKSTSAIKDPKQRAPASGNAKMAIKSSPVSAPQPRLQVQPATPPVQPLAQVRKEEKPKNAYSNFDDDDEDDDEPLAGTGNFGGESDSFHLESDVFSKSPSVTHSSPPKLPATTGTSATSTSQPQQKGQKRAPGQALAKIFKLLDKPKK